MLLLAGPPAAWSQQAHRAVETEPNETSATANRAALGDTLIGTISNERDVDFFVLDIPAGTFVTIHAGVGVSLVDQDGVTFLQGNPEDFPMSFPVTRAGRYYVRVRAGQPHTGEVPMGPYRLTIEAQTFALEAADPIRPFVDVGPLDLGPSDTFLGMAAGLNGELYVASSNRILRIDPNGDTATIASAHFTGAIAVDGFGDVVVARVDTCGSTATVIWKISPAGTMSPFTREVHSTVCWYPWTLAVGSDGDVWVGSETGIIRLDPTGVKKSEIPLGGAYRLATGPSGSVYAASAGGQCYYGITVVRASDVECRIPWIESTTPSYEITIDQDGGVYVGDYGTPDIFDTVGNVEVFPPGSTTAHPYAHVPHVRALAFARGIEGNMISRLFAIQVLGPTSRVVELDGANERPIGAGFNVRFFHAALDRLPPAKHGAAYQQALHVTADATSLTWSIENGTLPRGLTLSAAGVLQGTPNDTGSFTFTVRATSGIRSWFAPGTIWVASGATVEVTVTQVLDALLGGSALSPAQVEYLDQLGNNNGILDVGDLRAYLRSRGQLTTNPASP